jgi:hypothetical protein
MGVAKRFCLRVSGSKRLRRAKKLDLRSHGNDEMGR